MRKPSPSGALIARAMHASQAVIAQAAREHLQAFAMQMREKVGVDEIALDEPYLPFLLVQSELRYLRRMAALAERIDAAEDEEFMEEEDDVEAIAIEDDDEEPDPEDDTEESEDDEEDDDEEEEDDDDDEEEESDTKAAIRTETNRSILETKQGLDAVRQQAFGLTRYLWVGGDCPLCSPRDGQIFTWGNGLEPGDIHPNCQCSAEPVLEGAGEPKPPKISATDIAMMAALVAILGRGAVVRGLAIAAVQRLGSVGSRVLARVRRDTPAKPAERPKNVPKHWEQLPADKQEGTKYVDPNNPHNDLRIQKGNPNSKFPNQRRDYVRWKKNGQWLDKNGEPSTDPEKTHIPFEEFNFDLEIFK